MAQQDNEAEQKQIGLQKIYLKDLSFESPNAPEVFTQQPQPELNLNLNTEARGVGDNVYEVVLTGTVTVKEGDKSVYLIEAQQAGLFNIIGFDKEELGPLLGSYCPNVLFPYLRESISDIVTRGGFPQLLLNPVDFNALYAQHLQQQQHPQNA